MKKTIQMLVILVVLFFVFGCKPSDNSVEKENNANDAVLSENTK
jgi:type III secretory pathway lipoprotein EscJ